jgi:hypothetical protein
MIPTDPVKPADLTLTRQSHSGDRSTTDTEHRPYLEKATGLLMDWYGVTAAQAETLIINWAYECRRSPEAVARVLVHQIWLGDEAYAERTLARTLEHALRNLPGVLPRPAAESVPIRDSEDGSRVTGG